MPEISRFYGIVVMLYYSDHDPPHFHARYQEHEALFEIDPLRPIRGWLPDRAARLVSEWADIHRNELLVDWARARVGEPLVSIPPLP